MTAIGEIAAYLDTILGTAATPDSSGAVNGIQVETTADIRRIAAAVDARERTIEMAHAAGAQLLIVHHGLFWNGVQPLRGPFFRRVRALLGNGIGVYSSHLPLDAHPKYGNNALLARTLGLEPTEKFARYESIDIGVAGRAELPTAELEQRASTFAAQYATAVRTAGMHAGRVTRHWAICSGAGAGTETLREAASRGIDTLIVGEGPHHSAVDAEELGIAVIYAGHYATEVLGVRAIAEHAAAHFGLEWSFLDVPTGL
jgi:dinuclear metal center YbgI/SA1388 family protein